MNAKVEVEGSRLDTLKLLAALGVLVGGVVAFYYFADVAQTWMRVLALLALIAVSAMIALQTDVGRNTWVFLSDARMEVRKVVWPSWNETVQTTLVVLGVVILVGILLWLLDMLLLSGVTSLTSQGG
ncbi:preprotein translocase subunit SecE [Solemya pervernicosa gill symbiont]|uniref:Protein translocase subunit SecE n=2 Tax=Gammaproteobacteria incertae sedis TaxID=118884 RepID=A0A1T2L1F5_9GAMM|nr:preprotein translocase subunit SecE [Candidatus Reidiella endopervernicosa]OOZ38904.1 preprotein translocase subunit SecE [Solemya pervernicosa gill symbiont]QKQ26068.1 preprotein translocase subunit SecE [Candidatus Reidiella endopervernicosa]